MNFRLLIGIFISWALLNTTNAQIPYVRITVEPKGTNQIALTLNPVDPTVYYEVLARTNGPDGHWMMLAGYIGGSNNTISAIYNLGGIPGLTLNTLNNWKFFAGRWDDTLGDELPPFYKELVLRIDPYASGDPNADPMGDGWVNIQKLQNNMDPYRAYPPPVPQLSVKFLPNANDRRYGNAELSWQFFGGPVPDYVLIERANRTMRPATNNWQYPQRPPFGLNGRFPTNRPPNFRPMNRFGGWQQQGEMVTGLFAAIARVQGQLPKNGYSGYRYVDTNVDTLFQPVYRIWPHYNPPLRARLRQVDAAAIRKTIISVAGEQTTDGYSLTVPHPIPYASYLLLVRDKNDPQWRASGYFESGANRDLVYLHVDKKGMMHEGQRPMAMPEVKFLPDVVEPEFVAGWGGDSDGDGLPDVYEVLVIHTDPDDADTGGTGILDGYKVMTSDGWDNLEKFRRRVDPLRPAQPPPLIELRHPTEREIMNAVVPKTDLSCDLQIEIRTNDATGYQPIEQVPWMISQIMNFRQQNERKDFDLRIFWKFAEPVPKQYEYDPLGQGQPLFEALEALIQKMSIQLIESFKTNLATNPPLSPTEVSNKMVEIDHVYRQGGMEKELAMEEMMMVDDNQSQDFYGKIVDQYGQPVVGAEVNVAVLLSMGGGSSQKTQTDANGLFQFTGLRGESLSITPKKEGYQIDQAHLGLRGKNGPETNPDHRAIYSMWKLRGPEPMIHNNQRYQFKSDNRIYTIDLLSGKMVEGTNGTGDLLVQFQRPSQIKPHENFEWAFTMTAIGGGVIEVTNDGYLNEAPANGYQPQYKFDPAIVNLNGHGWNGEVTFYLKSRNGKVYGHFHIRVNPVSRDGSSLEIESYVNPSGSRNLEFDPAK
ncbi:MAG TPA: carboxypeptidase-like regulatory domain-containing protein [Verrucomicrobiae bacterium]